MEGDGGEVAVKNSRLRRLLNFLKNAHNVSNPSSYQKMFAPQFTWMEALLLFYMVIMYIVVWVVIVSIIVDKYNDKSSPSYDYLYVVFLVVPHVIAGVKNLHYHSWEIKEKQTEPSWFIHLLCLPFSPLLRYIQALNFGRKERGSWEGSLRFVTEMILVVSLRLIDTLLGCSPIAVLLIKEDILRRSSDWELILTGNDEEKGCPHPCDKNHLSHMAWHVSRILILTSQVAMNLSLYSLAMKRYHHLEAPELYEHHTSRAVRSGKVNIIGSALLFGAHFTFVTSRLLGYSMVLTTAPWYFLLVISLRWLTNVFWYLLTTIYSIQNFALRALTSFTIGGVWLLGFTNELRGSQLGRYVIFYLIAIAESLFCCTIWFFIMNESDDFFTTKAIWAVLASLSVSGTLFALYYTGCHPSHLEVNRRALRCCHGTRDSDLLEARLERSDDSQSHSERTIEITQ